MDAKFGTRARRRLETARDRGYLDATRAGPSELVRAHGLWCWRLRIPLIWFERRSPHSRFGSLHLEMFTTAHRLTQAGQSALSCLSEHATVCTGEACWRKVPIPELDRLAREAYRKATQAGNYHSKAAVIEKPRPRVAVAAVA